MSEPIISLTLCRTACRPNSKRRTWGILIGGNGCFLLLADGLPTKREAQQALRSFRERIESVNPLPAVAELLSTAHILVLHRVPAPDQADSEV